MDFIQGGQGGPYFFILAKKNSEKKNWYGEVSQQKWERKYLKFDYVNQVFFILVYKDQSLIMLLVKWYSSNYWFKYIDYF